jgi:esterase
MILFHRRWGDRNQRVPVVVIHGLFGSLENLGMIANLLKEEYEVFGLDLPSHGRSAHVRDLTLASMAKMVTGWMDSMGLESAHFLGHSLGGKVSMELALRYPARVESLVVADISPVAYLSTYPSRHDDIFAALEAVNLASLSSRSEADQLMRRYVPEPATRAFLLKNLEKKTDGWRWRMDLVGLKKNYSALIAANSDCCPPFAKSVLFIKGERSPYILPEHKVETIKRFPKAEIKIIGDTAHWLHAEKPELFTRIVRHFFDKIA